MAWGGEQEALVSTSAVIKQCVCFKQDAAMSTFNDLPLKFADRLTFFGINNKLTEKDVNICITKAWTAIEW